MMRSFSWITLILLCVLAAGSTSRALAQMAVCRIGDATASPGQTGITLPVTLTLPEGYPPLAELWFYLRYDPTAIGRAEVESAWGWETFDQSCSNYYRQTQPGFAAGCGIAPAGSVFPSGGTAANLVICIRPDASPGEYRVEADDDMSRRVKYADGSFSPFSIEAGTLTIAGERVPGSECPAEKVPAVFRLGDAVAAPGASGVRIPFYLIPKMEVARWEVTVKYDPDVIGNVRPVNACDWDLLFYGVESFSEPGVAAFRAKAGATSNELLAANGGLAAYLEFCVLPTAPPGDHVLGYADRPEGLRDVMNMCAMTDGYTWTYTPVLRNGKLTVAGDAVPGDCPHDPPPLTRIFPETKIALGTAEAAPGSTEVRVPITVTSNGPMISRWDIGVLYDPETIGNVTVENTCDWIMEVCGVDTFWDSGVLGVIAGSTRATEEKWRASGGIAAYLKFCVLPTAAPGEYPLIFVDDPPGKHYIRVFCTTEIGGSDPALQTGKLIVAGDPVSADACPRDPPPPMRPAGSFQLEGGTAHAGEEIVVPFIARGNYPLCAFSISIDFDEEVLEAFGVEKAFARPDGQDWNCARFIIDNGNATPGSNGVDEGYIAGGADFDSDPGGNEANLPPQDTDVTLLNLRFRVRPEAPSGETTLAFIDGTRTSDGGYWENVLGAGWWSMKPEQQISPIRIGALFRIIRDPNIFLRGDANADGNTDISDAVATLSYLFLGINKVPCEQAGDVNDDGTLDMSDAVYTLSFLFLGGKSIEPPVGACGVDPTGHDLPCSSFPGCQ